MTEDQLPDVWRLDTGKIGLSWPSGRPDTVHMSTELLEAIIATINDLRGHGD